MNPTSKDIATIVESHSANEWVFGVNLFIGKEPEMPNCVATIYDTTSMKPVTALNGSEGAFEFPAVQLRVRDSNYASAYSKIHTLLEFLNGQYGLTVGDTLISSILAVDSPVFLEYDNKNRAIFIINFEITRRKQHE